MIFLIVVQGFRLRILLNAFVSHHEGWNTIGFTAGCELNGTLEGIPLHPLHGRTIFIALPTNIGEWLM